nr:MAG TPA: hypothetical protein [Caudoviricetes sp.]
MCWIYKNKYVCLRRSKFLKYTIGGRVCLCNASHGHFLCLECTY